MYSDIYRRGVRNNRLVEVAGIEALVWDAPAPGAPVVFVGHGRGGNHGASSAVF
jgi:hypothetical protein